ncbi:restriction endonuclease subunit S [Methanosphaera cuniculi]|uniref:restriction endonuclease subunit S n=1 Tax=Methanosphaera cuniculi TaxID=1077256 RepID=UPI0026E94404|nr:restriction endonuclease subunit S [Methanosphaera cuniculi]
MSNIPKTGLSNLLEGWEEVKIGDIFSERNEKRNDPNLELLSVTLKDGVIKRSEINSKDNSSKDKSNYKLVKPGDIVYNSMRMWQGASGISKYEGLVSPAYTVLSPKNTISSHFFKYYFKTQKMLNKFKKYSQGLTSDTWNLKYPTISQIKIKSPLSKKQKEIENFITHFLSEIDTKITLMEKKHSLYVDIKKYLLKNLFVHGDEKSFLRFKRYNNILQRVSLSEILKESKIKSKDDMNKRISVKLNLKGVVKRIPNTNEIEGATTQYLRKKGQFIYGKQNLYKGAFGIVPSNLDGYLSSNDIPSFDFIKPIDEMWLFYYLSDKDYYTKLERLSTGTGSKRISPENFLKIKINIPPIEEQKEISNMLKLLDYKIENIKKQIFLFSKFKKGLLQKMFC